MQQFSNVYILIREYCKCITTFQVSVRIFNPYLVLSADGRKRFSTFWGYTSYSKRVMEVTHRHNDIWKNRVILPLV